MSHFCKMMAFGMLMFLYVGLIFAGGNKESTDEISATKGKQVVEIFWHMTEYETWMRETMKPLFESKNPDIELKTKQGWLGARVLVSDDLTADYRFLFARSTHTGTGLETGGLHSARPGKQADHQE